MKKVSAVILMSVIAFFITTASSQELGKAFEYRTNTYGWPNRFLTIVYEKARATDLTMEWKNLGLDFGFWLILIGSIRLCFWMMRVKRKSYKEQLAELNNSNNETGPNQKVKAYR